MNVEEKDEGMGAMLHENGVAFRVWAPHADAVAVTGSFNHWSEAALPLEREENGHWYADVEAASAVVKVPAHGALIFSQGGG